MDDRRVSKTDDDKRKGIGDLSPQPIPTATETAGYFEMFTRSIKRSWSQSSREGSQKVYWLR